MNSHLVWSKNNPTGLATCFGGAAERIYVDFELGLISVEHDGHISWDELQAIKNHWWGEKAVAIEIYPPSDRVVNNIAMRHLWKLGSDDWWPDLGREGKIAKSTLRERYSAAVTP